MAASDSAAAGIPLLAPGLYLLRVWRLDSPRHEEEMPISDVQKQYLLKLSGASGDF